MLYYAEPELDVDGGIMITGSHNPANYNGFKMVLFCGASSGRTSRRSADGSRTPIGRRRRLGFPTSDQGHVCRFGLVPGFRRDAFRIAWDAGNGAGGRCGAAVEEVPGEHHSSNEIDGSFPTTIRSTPSGVPFRSESALSRERLRLRNRLPTGDATEIGASTARAALILGRPIALDPGGAGASRASRLHHHRDVKASQRCFDRIAELAASR
jgi:phosphomannomutase